MLMEMISVAGAIELDLFNQDPQAEQDPLGVLVYMGIGNAMEAMQARMSGKSLVGLTGVLLVHGIKALPMLKETIPENFSHSLREMRQSLNSMGHRDMYLVPLIFLTPEMTQTVYHPLWIPQEVKKIIREAKPLLGSSALSGPFEIPFGTKGIIECVSINCPFICCFDWLSRMMTMTMRNDKENKLRVRAKLTQKDLDTINSLTAGPKREAEEDEDVND
jgi:hypothetical protein